MKTIKYLLILITLFVLASCYQDIEPIEPKEGTVIQIDSSLFDLSHPYYIAIDDNEILITDGKELYNIDSWDIIDTIFLTLLISLIPGIIIGAIVASTN